VADRYAVRLERDVVGVTGPEASSFLQGQLSQDVLAIADGRSAWSWVLAPTGKVDALVRVTRLADDDWVLDTDAGWGASLLSRLNRFKLRTKVELAARPWLVVGWRGGVPDPDQAVGALIVEPWPHLGGADVMGEQVAPPPTWPVMATEAYEAVRIGVGMPRMGAELSEKTIPGETGLIDLTVSFTKGCYTGQELVARIDSRGGNVPRHLRGLLLAGATEAGTELIDPNGRPAGTVTSAAFSRDGVWVGLGYVRRGVDIAARLRAGADGPEVTVRELPL
jgi:folate-binding protein YgfZ